MTKTLIQHTIRKLGYLLRDYPDDKETAKMIKQWEEKLVCSEIWVIAGDEAIEEALLTLRPTVWKDVEQQVVLGELPAAQLPMKVEQWMENFRPYLKRAIEVYLKSTKRESVDPVWPSKNTAYECSCGHKWLGDGSDMNCPKCNPTREKEKNHDDL